MIARPPGSTCTDTLVPYTSLVRSRSSIAANSTLGLGEGEPAADARVQVTRNEQDGAVWFEAEHDGWGRGAATRHHRRRLYLAAGGEDLRGEETVTGAGGNPQSAVVRLHLPPSVHASMIGHRHTEIGRASCRARGGRYVSSSVVAVVAKKNNEIA